MKSVLSIIVSMVMGSLVFASGAQAATCTITGPTGPDSNNQCTVNTQNTCTVTNTNGINLSNNNSQTSSSGGASVTGNTTGGGATSGSANNTSSTNVSVAINNGGCVAQTTTTPTTTTPTTPTSGGRGGGQVQSVSTVATSQVQAPVGGVGAGAGGLALPVLGLSIGSMALGAYRLRKLTYGNNA